MILKNTPRDLWTEFISGTLICIPTTDTINKVHSCQESVWLIILRICGAIFNIRTIWRIVSAINNPTDLP